MLLKVGNSIINTDHITMLTFHPDQCQLQISEAGAESTWSLKGWEAEATWDYLTSQAVDVLVKDEPGLDYVPVCVCGHAVKAHKANGNCTCCDCQECAEF